MNTNEIVKAAIKQSPLSKGYFESEGNAIYTIYDYSLLTEDDNTIRISALLGSFKNVSGELRNAYFDEDYDDEGLGNATLNLVVEYDGIVNDELSSFGADIVINKDDATIYMDTVRLNTDVFEYISVDHIYNINIIKSTLEDNSIVYDNLNIDHDAVFPLNDNHEIVTNTSDLRLKAFESEFEID